MNVPIFIVFSINLLECSFVCWFCGSLIVVLKHFQCLGGHWMRRNNILPQMFSQRTRSKWESLHKQWWVNLPRSKKFFFLFFFWWHPFEFIIGSYQLSFWKLILFKKSKRLSWFRWSLAMRHILFFSLRSQLWPKKAGIAIK